MPLSAVQTAFSGNPLDRAEHIRTDPEVFGDLMTGDDARVVLLAGESRAAEDGKLQLASDTRILTDAMGDIAWQKPSRLRFLPTANTIFLGLDAGAPRYAALLDGSADDFAEMFEAEGAKMTFSY